MRKMNAMGEDWLDDHVFDKKRSRAGKIFFIFLLLFLAAYIFVIAQG